MKRIITMILISVSLQFGSIAQESQPIKNKEVNKDTFALQNNQVVINDKMIERFNNYKTEGEYLTWRDLVAGFDSQALYDLYMAYLNANLETQSLKDIKLALENEQTERLNNSNIVTSDLVWFNDVKQEINEKLRMSEMVVQK